MCRTDAGAAPFILFNPTKRPPPLGRAASRPVWIPIRADEGIPVDFAENAEATLPAAARTENRYCTLATRILPRRLAIAHTAAQDGLTFEKGGGMALYMVEAPHTPEECMAAFEDFSKHPRVEELVKSTMAGCRYGTHIAWTTAPFKDENEARSMVSLPALRQKMKVYQVDETTLEDIKALHG